MQPGIGTAMLVFVLLLVFRAASGQVQYTVKGTVTDYWFKPWSRDVQHFENHRFEVFVRGERWRIDLYRTDATNNIVRQTVGSENGTDIVHLSLSTRGPSMVLVEPEPFPVGKNVPAFVHLWLMYASGPYFAKRTGDKLPPIHEYAYRNNRPKPELPEERALIMLNGGIPKLPIFLAFFHPSLQRAPRQQPQGGSSDSLENGYTNAIYEASDHKTVGEFRLPGKMRFQYFLPGPSGESSNLAVLYLCEAQVDSVSDNCSADSTAIVLPGRFVARDLRVESGGNSNAIAIKRGTVHPSNSVSPTYNGNDFSKVPTLAELKKFQATPRQVWRAKKRSWVPLAVLALLTLAPLAALSIRAVKSKRMKAAGGG